jgi:hypothetical protein
MGCDALALTFAGKGEERLCYARMCVCLGGICISPVVINRDAKQRY